VLEEENDMVRSDGAATPEFSRLVAVGQLAGAATHRIEASAAERQALARRFGLLGVDRLAAEVRLTSLPRGFRLDAVLEAEVVQECVVTLDPVQSRIEEPFSLVYGEVNEGETHEIAGLEEEIVEPLPGEELDIGEAVAQQLSLALDPYPRAPGAAVPAEALPPPAVEHPFAALEKLERPG
jgi:uncharacterized metal-binding protein YceD (DUF177 family)